METIDIFIIISGVINTSPDIMSVYEQNINKEL